MKSILLSVDNREDLVFNIITEFQTECKKYATTSTLVKGGINVKKFSDGELIVDIKDSVRGARVYLMTSPNTSDKIMALNLAIDAAKRASAKEIIVILPYYVYARQDRKDRPRSPIGARVLAEMIEERGANEVVTFDLHNQAIVGFFKIPITHIEGRYLFVHHIFELIKTSEAPNNWALCAPDSGATKRVKELRDLLREKFNLDLPYVIIDKTRKRANEIDNMVLIGDVTGKHMIIYDDIIDTFGTGSKAVNLLLENNAQSVTMVGTHGVLSGKAILNIGKSKLARVIISDTLPFNQNCETPEEQIGKEKIEIISSAKQIAKTIFCINQNYSLEELLRK